MFVSLGCSFSRGERLFYHRWEELYDNSKSLKGLMSDVKHPYDPHDVWYKATTKDLNYMHEHTACGLLAKKLGCEYIFIDGTNDTNIKHIERIIELHGKNPDREIEFIVLQLTDVSRDLGTIQEIKEEYEKEEALNLLNNTIPVETCKKINALNAICKENKIGFYVWSWQNEIPNRLLTAGKFGNAEEYFVKIEYEGKEYISFNDILKQNDNLPLNLTRTFSKYGSTDGHPSLLFNEILCDSLFKKLGVNND